MSFEETKIVLNDLLWEFNGNNGSNGVCKITEALGHSFNVVFNSNCIVNINPKDFSCKGELAKYILNICF